MRTKAQKKSCTHNTVLLYFNSTATPPKHFLYIFPIYSLDFDCFVGTYHSSGLIHVWFPMHFQKFLSPHFPLSGCPQLIISSPCISYMGSEYLHSHLNLPLDRFSSLNNSPKKISCLPLHNMILLCYFNSIWKKKKVKENSRQTLQNNKVTTVCDVIGHSTNNQ